MRLSIVLVAKPHAPDFYLRNRTLHQFLRIDRGYRCAYIHNHRERNSGQLVVVQQEKSRGRGVKLIREGNDPHVRAERGCLEPGANYVRRLEGLPHTLSGTRKTTYPAPSFYGSAWPRTSR